ncbi:MAG: hypothetical protein JXA00_04395 [Candidatus Thermoplasmatota archaeon]|nr:hypothetical protein [Candidatus Thermoplasmatota archaeon]
MRRLRDYHFFHSTTIAVSPVIAVIMLVVVMTGIGATVYVSTSMMVTESGSNAASTVKSLWDRFSTTPEQTSGQGGTTGGDDPLGKDEPSGGGGTQDTPPAITSFTLIRTNVEDTGYIKDGDAIDLIAIIDYNALEDLTYDLDISALMDIEGSLIPDSIEDGQATWTFTDVVLSPVDGQKTVSLTVTAPSGSDTEIAAVYVDNLPPLAVEGCTGEYTKEGNVISWIVPPEDTTNNPYGVMIRRSISTEQPIKEIPPAQPFEPEGKDVEPESESPYPGVDEGDLVYFVTELPMSFTDTMPEGYDYAVCYYQVFFFDKAYNFSPANPSACCEIIIDN